MAIACSRSGLECPAADSYAGHQRGDQQEGCDETAVMGDESNAGGACEYSGVA